MINTQSFHPNMMRYCLEGTLTVYTVAVITFMPIKGRIYFGFAYNLVGFDRGHRVTLEENV